ncbi:MAG: putative RNAP associated protein fused to zincin protease [crAssphage sp. isolate ctbg_1]|uniref:Putative RNAP associated protein fused to zincin protease n=1 Tax=crAssphage sp. isolate ctbg_1 TaxID=2989854 RepID=A0A345MT41_9CAUD|nr:MAG: putative RNAP associated protein fused to zincin protease [crAssphage sp. isolate ctbg_1]AXH74541.1 MAG: putative RNAP associated protein fused to zincin protease [crAssphage sp. isolate ctbg_1]
MDVLSFLQHGNQKPNPEYNPKTKKGKYQAPTLVDYNPGTSISDTGRTGIGNTAARNLYSFNTDDVNLYAEYDTYLNKFDSQEDLDKERARNQSWLEQAGRSIAQGVVNEAVIGSVAGLSNLFDLAVNGVRYGIAKMQGEELTSDYTNELSSYLEEKQEALRKEWAIYRENPNDAFNLSDFGWWADNFVSVLTTASMLLPTMGVTKGLSLVGKGIRAASKAGKGGKLIKGLNAAGDWAHADNLAMKLANKFGNKYDSFKDIGKLSDRLRLGREITQNAVLSRSMENYMEARETFKTVQEEAEVRLASMTSDEKEEFLNNNPNLRGKTDKEIAEYIAGASADETFRNDYAMLLMDMIQFKGLADIYKGAHKSSNAALALAVKKEKDKLLNRVLPETATLRDKITNSDWLFKAKYMVNHPLDGMFAIEWSEGVEEMYQGIQSEKGKEVAEKMFNPNFTPRDIGSYLTDPVIYEQGFWGVMGAIGFSGIGKGLKWSANKLNNVEGLINDKKEIALRKLSDQMQRRKGIEGWSARTQSFIDSVSLINDGKNPLRPKQDKDGNPIKNENGEIEYEEINEDNKEALKKRLLNDYLVEVGFNASERGDFDTFMAFLADPEIAKHINDKTGISASTAQFDNYVRDRLTQVSNSYSKNLFNIRTSIHVKNPYVANIMAREMTRHQLQIEDNNDEIAKTDNIISELLGDEEQYPTLFEEGVVTKLAERRLQALDKAMQDIDKKLANGEISSQAYHEYKEDINKHRTDVFRFLNDYEHSFALDSNMRELFSALETEMDANQLSKLANDLISNFNVFKSQMQVATSTPSDAIIKQLQRKISLLYDNASIKSQLPKTTNDIQKDYNERAKLIDKLVIERHNDAVDTVIKWLEKQDDLDEARNNIYSGYVEEIQEALDILKIGHVSTRQFWANIDIAIKEERKRRNKEEERNATVVVDDEKLSEEESAAARTKIEESVPEEEPTSTGQQEEAEPTESNESNKLIIDGVDYTGIIPANVDNLTLNKIKRGLKNGTMYVKDDVLMQKNDGLPDIPVFAKPGSDIKVESVEEENIEEDNENNIEEDEETKAEEKKKSKAEEIREERYEEELDEDKDNDDEFKPDNIDNNYLDNGNEDNHDDYYGSSINKFDTEYLANDINDRNTNVDVDRRTASAIVRDIIINEPERFKNLNIDSVNTKEFQDLLDYLASKIKDKIGGSIEDAKTYAKYAIAVQYILIKGKTSNNEITNLAKLIAAELKESGRYSTAPLIEPQVNEKDAVEMVDKLLKEYVKNRKVFIGKQGPTINILRLLDYVINKTPGMSVEESTAFFMNLYRIINRNSDLLKYKFINLKELTNTYRNPNSIREKLASVKNKTKFEARYQHIAPATREADVVQDILKNYTFGNPIEVTYDPLGVKDARNVRFWIGNTEVGYLAPVGVNAEQDTYWTLANNGFKYTITKNNDGSYNMHDFDVLFKELLLNADNNKDLYDAIFNREVTTKSAKLIINHPLIKPLIDKGLISFRETINTDFKKGKDVAEKIRNIANFDIMAETPEEKYQGIGKFKRNIFENYEMTYKLMTAQKATVTFRNVWQGILLYDTEKDFDVNSRGFTAKDNPIISVVNATKMIAEGIEKPYTNRVGFPVGTMGFLIRDSDTGVAVARITRWKKVTENKKISDLLNKELNDMFYRYANDSNYTFEKFRDDIRELFGGTKYNGKSLFYGVSVVTKGDYFSLVTQGGESGIGKFIFTVNKYKKGTKELSKTIYFNTKGEDRHNFVINKAVFDKASKALIDTINKHIRFSASHFTLNNINKKNVSNTKYMYIDRNGKFVINIGGQKLTYDSFTDFVLTENVARTNQLRNKDGGYFDSQFDMTSMFVDAQTVNYQSPVKGEDLAKPFQSPDDVKKVPAGTPINTNDVLDVLDVNQDVIDFLNDLAYQGLPIVPNSVYYEKGLSTKARKKGEKDNNTKGRFNATSGRVYISDYTLDNHRGMDAVLTLIHEQIHYHFSTLDKATKKKILNDLADIHDDIVKCIQRDVNSSDPEIRRMATSLRDWMNITFLSVETFGNNLKGKAKRDWNGKTNEQRIEYFFEDWLVECMSQPMLMKYLNDTEYREANIEATGPRTLFQRLMELLMKLFNTFSKYKGTLQNINNNSILATQFQILSGNYVKVDNTIQTTETVKDDTTEKIKPEVKAEPTKEPVSEPTAEPTKESITEPASTEPIVPENDNDKSFLSDEQLKSIDDMLSKYEDDTDTIYDEDMLDDDDRLSTAPLIEPSEQTLDDKIDKFATNPEVNNNGFIPLTNIQTVTDKFEEHNQKAVEEVMNNGTIKWVCT